MTPRKLPLELTPEEFRERIRMIATGRSQITGAPHAHPSLVRKPTDLGFYLPTRSTQKQIEDRKPSYWDRVMSDPNRQDRYDDALNEAHLEAIRQSEEQEEE
jgi:hypothetical protein